jgi:hypothetical protein
VGEDPPVTAAAAALERLSVLELKAVLRLRGEKLSGRKGELQERVRAGGGLGLGLGLGLGADNLAYQATASSTVSATAAAAAAAAAAPKSKPKPKPTTKPTPEKRPPLMVWRVSNPAPPPRARRWDTDVDGPALRVVSWNVNGIRALLDKVRHSKPS